MAKSEILDAWGRPIQREALTVEVAGPTLGGVRSPLSGYPADGLNPERLASILREADIGDPIRFLELAETIEERDPHYLGVIGTRRRSVSQLDITIEAGSDDPEDEAIAQMVRVWIDRDELSAEIFDILDAIPKGYSATEVVYDLSEGQYQPRLIHRDPRWFRFDRLDLSTPMLLGDGGQYLPLDPGHFIFATMKAKSGLPLRSGLSRVAAWGWMFKAFTQRDWAIFSQTYGQPVRLGKYQSGASREDKQTLFRAVSNIAGDCAAIIPESMTIDFVESGNVGASHQLYKERADWIDQQISKAVLGQTSTTDAVIGGLGSGKEHREVQKSIERADAKALAAILNRDLIRVWVQLEFGPRKVYPRLRIGQEDERDLSVLATALAPMIDRGLEIDSADLRDHFGFPEPKPAAKLLYPQGGSAALTSPVPPTSGIKRVSGEIKRGQPPSGIVTAPQASDPLAGLPAAPAPEDILTDRMAVEAAPAMDAILAKVGEMMDAAGSLEELRQMFLDGFPDVPGADLTEVLAMGMLAANLGGRVAIAEDAQTPA
ncbi:MAG: DUF935 domain-containing protein [Cypionkella sp.]